MSGFFGNRNESPILSEPRVGLQPLMRMVYAWMTLGLLVTGGVAVYTANMLTTSARSINPGLFLGGVIVELALVMGLSWGIRRLSPGVAIAMFLIYAAVNGFTLSVIFLVYNLGTIQLAFFSTAATFAVMSVVGYTTQLDLSQYRTYFIMGLIGVIVASLVNVFLRSTGFELLISLVGVVLFTALTAYDTQRIKRMASDPEITSDTNMSMKLGILGALTLYLDFVNLFLFLLRLFGRRR